jgi:hypothetical protein
VGLSEYNLTNAFMKLPPYPDNVGKRRAHGTIDGRRLYKTIEDEIVLVEKSKKRHIKKLIYFQKLRFEEDGRLQYRFTYYMLGFKAGPSRGRWVFGQYSLMIDPKDLTWLLKAARKRKWPGV